MAKADLVLANSTQIVTAKGPPRARRGNELSRAGIIRDGAIAIRDGRILQVGPTKTIRAAFSARKTVDLEGRAVVPGFVDPHTHLPFAGSRAFELEMKLAGRSYLEILAAGGGIHRTVADTRAITERDLVKTLRRRMELLSTWGTTTAEAKSGYGLTFEDELKQLRAVKTASGHAGVDLVPTFLGAHVVPKEHQADRRAYLRLLLDEMIPEVARHGLAEFCDAFLEDNAFDREECAKILTRAREYGLKLKLHADEFTNQRGAQLACRLGCTSAEHLLEVNRGGVKSLARSTTIAVMLPGVSVTGMLGKYAPAQELVDAGAAVALGTDFNPNCHVLSLPTVLQWAVYHLRLPPTAALLMATVNAAYACGRGNEVGSLEPGKLADLVVLDSADPVDLFYRLGVNPVYATYKRGQKVAERGRPVKAR